MNEYDIILRIISQSTKYMRTYLGKVIDNNDVSGRSRIKMIIPGIGIIDDSEGVWVDVEQPIGQNVCPSIGSWLSVYFVDGDASKPVARGLITNVIDNVLKSDYNNLILYKDDNLEIIRDLESNIIRYKDEGLEIIRDLENNTTSYKSKGLEIISEDSKITISTKELDISVDGDANIDITGNANINSTKTTINNHLEVS